MLDGEKSVTDCDAPVIVVSQFTLQGETKSDAARVGRMLRETAAQPLDAVDDLTARGLSVGTGVFGAMMNVHSVNAGPFTVLVDTHKRSLSLRLPGPTTWCTPPPKRPG